MSAIKIDKKIAKYRVQKPEDKAAADAAATAAAGAVASAVAAAVAKFEPNVEMTHDKQGRSSKVVRMTEEVQRPEMLVGSTYKIKTPVSDHAMYVTINDIVLNEGTPYEQRRPFEVFINSKNLDHFQWIVALTRIISAVFRKGGDVTFLVDELKAVFDPRGGYWQSAMSSRNTCRRSGCSKNPSSTSTRKNSSPRRRQSLNNAPSRLTRSPSRIFRKARSSAPSAAPPPSS
jgi:hypothetical protein